MRRTTLAFGLALGIAAFGVAGCGEGEGPAEQAGKEVDEAIEGARGAATEAAEKADEALDEVGDAAQEAAEAARQRLEDTQKEE
jgi:hypothetical protein